MQQIDQKGNSDTKIKFTTNNFLKIVGLITLIPLVVNYVYLTSYFNSFGINASSFLEYDELLLSYDSMILIIMLITAAYLVFLSIVIDYESTHELSPKRKLPDTILVLLLFLLFIMLPSWMYFRSKNLLVSDLNNLWQKAIFLNVTLAVVFLVLKYKVSFTIKSRVIILLSTGLAMMLVYVSFYGSIKALKVKANLNIDKKLQFSLNNKEYETGDTLGLLYLNKSMVFLYDRNSKKVLYLPLNTVTNISTIEKE